MRIFRTVLAVGVAAVLLPTVWIRSQPPPNDPRPIAAIARLAVDPGEGSSLRLAGAWEITSNNTHFGGFSALAYLGEGRFVAGSDAGFKMLFDRPDRGATRARLSRIEDSDVTDKRQLDLESLTRDPDSGKLWAGYEGSNSIVRLFPDLEVEGMIAPRSMADWGSNSGPEALARLADGRFLVIRERTRSWVGSEHDALLFPDDPLAGARPKKLMLTVPHGYRPVDAVALDSTRVLVLYRRFTLGLPVRFYSAVGTVSLIGEPGKERLETGPTYYLADAIPHDNYEGMAVTRDRLGLHLWLISDDNFMSYQRTLLLKLRLPDEQKCAE